MISSSDGQTFIGYHCSIFPQEDLVGEEGWMLEKIP